jgi:Family of unknown function (DUF6535)
MHFTEAEAEERERDVEITESWKELVMLVCATTSSLCLVFIVSSKSKLLKASFFSATVAIFIIQSYQLLSPDPGDETIAWLAQISQQLVDISHGTPLQNVTAPNHVPFKPSALAIRVNVLWLLSLVFSITCALSASLLQRRVRGYMSPAACCHTWHRCSQAHSSLLGGAKRFEMSRAVEIVTTLLHISIFLFLAGLVDFLLPVNATVAFCILSYILTFMFVYMISMACPYLSNH